MSLLDDNFDITAANVLAPCFKYLMNPNNYIDPSKHSLWGGFWRIRNQLQHLNILVETVEEIPSQFIIGWNHAINEFSGIKIKVFDINNIILERDRIIYKDGEQEYLYKFYKSSFHGMFGNYRLYQEDIYGQYEFPGFNIFQIDDIINKFISHKKYIRLPLTDMEHYSAYQKKLRGETDYFQIINHD